MISVVAPLYNEEDNIRIFVEKLGALFERLGYRWELVLALDPSTDRTREITLQLIHQGYPIRLVTFSRRIGKPLSVLAGLDHSRGDACVVMDVDLQDPPDLIEEMVEKWREGFLVVIAQRRSRKGERYLYLKAAEFYYWILGWISEVHVPRNAGDYRLLDSRAVREICRFRERHGFLRGITAAVGFPTTVVTFDRDPRFAGKTQISFLGAANIALDGIVPFSRIPVRCAAGVLRGFSDQWPVLFLSFLSLVLSGITLAGLGVIGEYVHRTYEEARERPLYIIDEIQEAETVPRKLFDPRKTRDTH